jgi:hypothetical protein
MKIYHQNNMNKAPGGNLSTDSLRTGSQSQTKPSEYKLCWLQARLCVSHHTHPHTHPHTHSHTVLVLPIGLKDLPVVRIMFQQDAITFRLCG